MKPIILYRNPVSGHAHRVELFLSLLKVPFQLVDVNLRAGEQKQPDFLRKNPFGQVPVIEDGDVTLADSNAILCTSRSATTSPAAGTRATPARGGARAAVALGGRRATRRRVRQPRAGSSCSAFRSTMRAP